MSVFHICVYLGFNLMGHVSVCIHTTVLPAGILQLEVGFFFFFFYESLCKKKKQGIQDSIANEKYPDYKSPNKMTRKLILKLNL